MADASLTINQIIEARPEAMKVLGSHGLDLCCGGSKTLSEAAAQHGLDLDRLLAELESEADRS